jgi:hypothetical protein
MKPACGRTPHRLSTLALAAALIAAAATAMDARQADTSARLRIGQPPAPSPEAFGGGEVVLEASVDANGIVTRVVPLRVTPPFTEPLINAVYGWQFEPASSRRDGVRTAVAGSVLVAAVFRPKTLYAAPAPGAVPQTLVDPSPALPRPESLVMPAYPPNAYAPNPMGDEFVVVEIEMTRFAAARGYRVVGTPTGFDSAALDAVRAWRFAPPRAADAERLFVYAVVGFRVPVTARD